MQLVFPFNCYKRHIIKVSSDAFKVADLANSELRNIRFVQLPQISQFRITQPKNLSALFPKKIKNKSIWIVDHYQYLFLNFALNSFLMYLELAYLSLSTTFAISPLLYNVF